MIIAQLILWLSLLGLLSSAVFLLLVLAGTLHFRSYQKKVGPCPTDKFPPVSVLKPLHGLEPRLRENIESFFRQDYPDYEILFAVDTDADAALDVVREVSSRYPHIRCRTLVNGLPPWPNPPAYSFQCMSAVAEHDILVTSDSDVEVAPNYLREVVFPLLDPKIGMVTCIYRGKNAGGFWSGMDAIGMSVEMTAGVLVANLLEGIKFGLGPTIAVRKDSLAKIGGYAAIGHHFSNDFAIGNLIDKAGYQVVVSKHIIDHVVPPMTFRRMWERQVRWATGTRYSRPKGHFGTVFIFAMPYGILAFLAASLMGHVGLGLSLLAIAVFNRVAEALAVGWGVVRDPVARNKPWLYPIRDLLGFFVWCASYIRRQAVWRDGRYRLIAGGRIELRENYSERAR